MRAGTFAIVALLAALTASCSREESSFSASAPVFHEEGFPKALSDWNVVAREKGRLHLASNTTPYDLATPLFSDYALKLRTISLPDGTSANYREGDVLDFPVGTVITKTFYYSQNSDGSVTDENAPKLTNGSLPLDNVRLMETRVLAHRSTGWVAIPYVWNADQTDAVVKRTGDVVRLTLARTGQEAVDFPYVVPNQNQCKGCHAPNNTTRALSPIGPKVRHLNKASTYHAGLNQLEAMAANGFLTASAEQLAAAPQNAVWTNEEATVNARARAYLDSNCSHCHNPKGPADTSGLDLTPSAAYGPKLGHCKAPIAAGDGTGGRKFDIVPGHPDDSILVHRLETIKPAEMMPELGRALSHAEGVSLIREWVASLEGEGCA